MVRSRLAGLNGPGMVSPGTRIVELSIEELDSLAFELPRRLFERTGVEVAPLALGEIASLAQPADGLAVPEHRRAFRTTGNRLFRWELRFNSTSAAGAVDNG